MELFAQHLPGFYCNLQSVHLDLISGSQLSHLPFPSKLPVKLPVMGITLPFPPSCRSWALHHHCFPPSLKPCASPSSLPSS
eukprot:scaffold127060_cov76-Cyclotella_meneghiniana.AAC.1